MWKNPISSKYRLGELLTYVHENREKYNQLIPQSIVSLVTESAQGAIMCEQHWLRKSAFFRVLINHMYDYMISKSDNDIDNAAQIFILELNNYSQLMFPIWEDLKKSTDYNFNPLENYDRYEETATDHQNITITNNSRSFEKGEERNNTSNNYSQRENEDNRTDTSNNSIKYGAKIDTTEETRKNSPFDSEKFYNNENNINTSTYGTKTDEEENVNVTKNVHTENAHTDTSENIKSAYTDNENAKIDEDASGTQTVKSHIHGNIGVTTASKMLEEYRLLVDYNLLDRILSDIQKEFMISVYD